ncbi:MAG: hypothetical protein PHD31_02935, partial [Candidatus Pacebacteria bacterium]|nr:hypothetical protein [Candidatus Paceibacterota bacterium]
FSLNVQNNSVTMMGDSDGFKNIMEQIAILEREPTIQSFEISNVNLSENGRVSFTLNIILKSDLLK